MNAKTTSCLRSLHELLAFIGAGLVAPTALALAASNNGLFLIFLIAGLLCCALSLAIYFMIGKPS